MPRLRDASNKIVAENSGQKWTTMAHTLMALRLRWTDTDKPSAENMGLVTLGVPISKTRAGSTETGSARAALFGSPDPPAASSVPDVATNINKKADDKRGME